MKSRNVSIALLIIATTGKLGGCENEAKEMMGVEVRSTDNAAPILDIQGKGPAHFRWLWTKDEKDLPVVLWHIRFRSNPTRIGYGALPVDAVQDFPENGERPQVWPISKPVFLFAAYTFDGRASRESGLVQKGFVLDGRVRMLSQREYEAQFVPLSEEYAKQWLRRQ